MRVQRLKQTLLGIAVALTFTSGTAAAKKNCGLVSKAKAVDDLVTDLKRRNYVRLTDYNKVPKLREYLVDIEHLIYRITNTALYQKNHTNNSCKTQRKRVCKKIKNLKFRYGNIINKNNSIYDLKEKRGNYWRTGVYNKTYDLVEATDTLIYEACD